MAANDFFSSVGNVAGTALKGVGDIFGDVAKNVYDASVFGRRQKNIEKINSFLKSEKVQRKLTRARAASLDRGEGLYGGRRADKSYTPLDKFDELSTLEKFKGNYIFGKDSKTGEPNYIMSEEDKAAYKAARDYVLGREISGVDSVGDKGRDFVGPPAPSAFVGPPAPSAAEYLTDDFVGPPAPLKHDRTEGSLPPKPNEGIFDRLSSYFQAPTETVPEANIPKTYQQLGITSIDDQATLQEMQSAMPDRDMRDEYENDPESMQRLMKLWKAREIDKSDLRKFFSVIQQKARQALGVT